MSAQVPGRYRRRFRGCLFRVKEVSRSCHIEEVRREWQSGAVEHAEPFLKVEAHQHGAAGESPGNLADHYLGVTAELIVLPAKERLLP